MHEEVRMSIINLRIAHISHVNAEAVLRALSVDRGREVDEIGLIVVENVIHDRSNHVAEDVLANEADRVLKDDNAHVEELVHHE